MTLLSSLQRQKFSEAWLCNWDSISFFSRESTRTRMLASKCFDGSWQKFARVNSKIFDHSHYNYLHSYYDDKKNLIITASTQFSLRQQLHTPWQDQLHPWLLLPLALLSQELVQQIKPTSRGNAKTNQKGMPQNCSEAHSSLHSEVYWQCSYCLIACASWTPVETRVEKNNLYGCSKCALKMQLKKITPTRNQEYQHTQNLLQKLKPGMTDH